MPMWHQFEYSRGPTNKFRGIVQKVKTVLQGSLKNPSWPLDYRALDME